MRTLANHLCALLVSAVCATGCALLDPAEYEYITTTQVREVQLTAVALAPDEAEGMRQARVRASDGGCYSGCSRVERSRCEILSAENGEVVLDWSVTVKTKTEGAGNRDFACSAMCVTTDTECGIITWVGGEDLVIRSEDGEPILVPANAELPLYASTGER